MGLPSTSAEWNKKDSDKWCRKHVPNWHSGRKIIDVVTDDDKMNSYYKEGKKLYRVPQRRMKSDATYDREDLNLAASLRRKAAATAAAAAAPDESWD
jgi:hypothetical protein